MRYTPASLIICFLQYIFILSEKMDSLKFSVPIINLEGYCKVLTF